MDSNVLGSLACFVGVIAIGSSISDIFRFIPTETDMGHTPLIPVLILSIVAITYCIRLITRHILM